MKEYTTTKPVRPLLLVEELQEGLVGLDEFNTVSVAPMPGGGAIIYYPDTIAEEDIIAIVDAHDSSKLSEGEKNAVADKVVRGTLKGQYQTFKGRLNQIQTQMSGTPTNAQVVSAVKDMAQGMEKMLDMIAIDVRND